MRDDGYTISFPKCSTHPPLKDWPVKNLITSTCPRCLHQCEDEKTVREINARKLIREQS